LFLPLLECTVSGMNAKLWPIIPDLNV